jgi:DNA-binding MarR family transcriptional regulator
MPNVFYFALIPLPTKDYWQQSVNDGRVKKVFVTDKAREFQPVLFSILEEWTDTLFQGFSTEERELVLRLLHRIVKTASKIRTDEGDT